MNCQLWLCQLGKFWKKIFAENAPLDRYNAVLTNLAKTFRSKIKNVFAELRKELKINDFFREKIFSNCSSRYKGYSKSEKKMEIFKSLQKKFSGWNCSSGYLKVIFRTPIKQCKHFRSKPDQNSIFPKLKKKLQEVSLKVNIEYISFHPKLVHTDLIASLLPP